MLPQKAEIARLHREAVKRVIAKNRTDRSFEFLLAEEALEMAKGSKKVAPKPMPKPTQAPMFRLMPFSATVDASMVPKTIRYS